jgi:hypothetical protein
MENPLTKDRDTFARAAFAGCHTGAGTVPGDKAGTGRAAASALKEQLKKHITGAMPAAATPNAAAAAAEVAGEFCRVLSIGFEPAAVMKSLSPTWAVHAASVPFCCRGCWPKTTLKRGPFTQSFLPVWLLLK